MYKLGYFVHKMLLPSKETLLISNDRLCRKKSSSLRREPVTNLLRINHWNNILIATFETWFSHSRISFAHHFGITYQIPFHD